MVDTIDLLRQHGAKTKSIQQYIIDNSSLSPTLKDITNLIFKLKKWGKGSKTPVELLHAWMREFCEEDLDTSEGRSLMSSIRRYVSRTCIIKVVD